MYWLQLDCVRFQLFSPFTALALAPVEAHYSVAKVMFCLVSDLVTSNVSKHLKGRWSFHPLWFGQAHPLPYFGPPGSGLNGGVALMNLTRSN